MWCRYRQEKKGEKEKHLDEIEAAAGMLGNTISILLNTYAHYIPTMQDEAAQPARKSSSLGFAGKYAAQLMDDILTPIPIELNAR